MKVQCTSCNQIEDMPDEEYKAQLGDRGRAGR